MKVDVIWVENDYPHHSPFLKNKYKGLSASFDGVLFHYGMRKIRKNEIRNFKIPHSYMGLLCLLLIKLITCPLSSLRFISVLRSKHKQNWIRKLVFDSAFIGHSVKLIHFEFGTVALGKMYLGSALKCKLMVSFRGYDINYYKLGQDHIFKEIWEGATMLHFLGNDLRKRALKRGCPEDLPYCIINPAVDLALFSPANDDIRTLMKTKHLNKKFVVVSTGRLVWKKGFEYGVLAIKLLLDKGYNIEYRIIGDGNGKESLQFMVEELRLGNSVCLLGHMTHNQIAEELRSADMFLHPAVSEGFCNAVVEAQAVGLPVITTNADGLSENIEVGVTGFSIPIYNYELLAEKIEYLVNNPNERASFGRMGIKRANSLYDLNDQIVKFSEVYNKLISLWMLR